MHTCYAQLNIYSNILSGSHISDHPLDWSLEKRLKCEKVKANIDDDDCKTTTTDSEHILIRKSIKSLADMSFKKKSCINK